MTDIEAVYPTRVYQHLGVFNNIYRASVGQGLQKHEHTYPHLTICLAGRIVVFKENLRKELTATDGPVVLKENEWHAIKVLEPDTIFINSYAADVI